MKAVVVLLAAMFYIQWLSPVIPATIPTALALPDAEPCQNYEYYDPAASKSTSKYAVCKNVVLQPGMQLTIDVSPENVKYIIFRNNVIPVVPAGTFISFTELVQLYLNHNGMTTLIPSVFNGLTKLEELHLQANAIVEIPKGTLDSLTNLRILDLSRNAITSIKRGSFTGLLNLRNLDLSRNNLYYLDRDSFVFLTNLEVLDLSHNYLSIFAPSFVLDLTTKTLKKLLINNNLLLHFPLVLVEDLNLEFLDASFNALTEVDFGWVLGAKFANFSNNQISALEGWSYLNQTTVVDLRKNNVRNGKKIDGDVKKLYLGWNELEAIDAFMFNDSENIIELDLAYNILAEIDDSAFQGLISLEKLFLNNNQIRYLPVGCFTNLNSLTVLFLSHNSLASLQDGVFNGLSKLRDLYLDHNKLTTINEQSLSVLRHLRRLHLNNNLLTFINVPYLVRKLPYLTAAYLDHNNWDCRAMLNLTQTFQNQLAKTGEGNMVGNYKAFEVACDNFHLKVTSPDCDDEILNRMWLSLLVFLVLVVDVTIVWWYFVQLKLSLKEKKDQLRKCKGVLARIAAGDAKRVLNIP